MLVDALNSVIDRSRRFKYAAIESETLKQLYRAFLKNRDLNVISMNEVYSELCERGVFPQFLYVDFNADDTSADQIVSPAVAPGADWSADDNAQKRYGKRAIFDGIEETTHDGRNIRSRRYRVVDEEEYRKGKNQDFDRVGDELQK